MTTPDLSGAVDLGALAQQKDDTYQCVVEGGCNYRVRLRDGATHDTLKDCVDTAVVYAETVVAEAQIIARAAQDARELTEEVVRLRGQVDTLIGANRRFQTDLADKERRNSELRQALVQARGGSHAEEDPAA